MMSGRQTIMTGGITYTRLLSIIVVAIFMKACTEGRSTADLKDTTGGRVVDTQGWPERFGFGRLASASEIDSLNTEISPNGEGLPPGVGTILQGKECYAVKCAPCHGKTGVEGPYNKLVAMRDSTDEKTIGNYWPYATTLYDYIHRSMPFNAPGSLSPEEVYSLTAFLLNANQIIDSATVMNAETLPGVVMPARALFVDDDRRGGPEIR